MKNRWKIIFVMQYFLMMSCSKTDVKLSPLTSFNVVNTVVGGSEIKLGANPKGISNNSGTQFTINAGENDLYVWPVGDSAHPYYTDPKFNVEEGQAYSLFLGGKPTQVDAVLIKENLTNWTDSTAGIRFINLSPNSNPVNITLSTSTTVYEVSNLAYKQYTDFKPYPGLVNSSYTFLVRDANNSNTATNILTSFSFTRATLPRFANVTLVIRGLVGTSPNIGVTRINNDR